MFVYTGSDGLLSSPMSPDEEIIKRRGQIRTSPRKRAFQTSTPAITEIGKNLQSRYICTIALLPNTLC